MKSKLSKFALIFAAVLPVSASAAGFGQFNSTQARADVVTSSGVMTLSGSAINGGEARKLGFNRGETRLAFPLGTLQGQIDMRWFKSSNVSQIDTYNNSLLGAVHVLVPTANGHVGLFAGAVHTEQGTQRKNSSRRLFTGVEIASFTAPHTRFDLQAGIIFHTGGLDGRGKDSLTNAGFIAVAATSPLSAQTSVDFTLAAAYGQMDFDKIPPDAVLAVSASIAVTHRLKNQRGRIFARWEVTTFNRRSAGTNLLENRISVGFKLPFGKPAPAGNREFAQHLAPIGRWVAQTGGPLK